MKQPGFEDAATAGQELLASLRKDSALLREQPDATIPSVEAPTVLATMPNAAELSKRIGQLLDETAGVPRAEN